MKVISHWPPPCKVARHMIGFALEKTGTSRHSHGRGSAAISDAVDPAISIADSAKEISATRISVNLLLGRLAQRGELFHDRAEVRVFGREDGLDPEVEQALAILLRHNSANHQLDVAAAIALQQRDGLARDRHVRARQAADGQDLGVLL